MPLTPEVQEMFDHARAQHNFDVLVQTMNRPNAISVNNIQELFKENDICQAFVDDWVPIAQIPQNFSELQRQIIDDIDKKYLKVQKKLAECISSQYNEAMGSLLSTARGAANSIVTLVTEILIKLNAEPKQRIIEQINCLIQYPMMRNALVHQLCRLKFDADDQNICLALITNTFQNSALKRDIVKHLIQSTRILQEPAVGLSPEKLQKREKKIQQLKLFNNEANTEFVDIFIRAVFPVIEQEANKLAFLDSNVFPLMRTRFILYCLNKRDNPDCIDGLNAFEQSFLAQNGDEVEHTARSLMPVNAVPRRALPVIEENDETEMKEMSEQEAMFAARLLEVQRQHEEVQRQNEIDRQRLIEQHRVELLAQEEQRRQLVLQQQQQQLGLLAQPQPPLVLQQQQQPAAIILPVPVAAAVSMEEQNRREEIARIAQIQCKRQTKINEDGTITILFNAGPRIIPSDMSVASVPRFISQLKHKILAGH